MALDSYRRVVPSFWNDPDVRTLSQSAKLALLYYVTSPHGNMAGVYHCPTLYAAREIGMEEADLRDLIGHELAPFLVYDPDTEEVFVRAMARHQIEAHPKPGDKRLAGVTRLLLAIHSPDLLSRFLTEYAHWRLKIEAPSKPLRSPFEGVESKPEGASYTTPAPTPSPASAGTRNLGGEFGTWVDPFAAEWERLIGMASKPKLAAALWPLVQSHGMPQVYATWQGYLREGKGKPWVAVAHFVRTYKAIAERWALVSDAAGREAPIPDRPGCLSLEAA